jgi:nucleoside-diphosphate-sugar epimerase
MRRIETEVQLEDELSTPSPADIDAMRAISGDIMVLGAGGKIGPSLTRLVRRACDRAGVRRRVIAVSLFSESQARPELERLGIETIDCNLLDMEQVLRLPLCENVLFLAGRKFGSTDRPDATWAINTLLPVFVARRFADARIVAFSTGNVYPFVPVSSGGSVETDATAPVGEYAQSCLGRERLFEYCSRENGTRIVVFRLNYAVDLRYGVLVDIGRKVFEGQPVPLTVAHFNILWQRDAGSYALRSLALCQSPPFLLNVTGPEILSVRDVARFFAGRFGREVQFTGEASDKALLSNAARCHALLGRPGVTAEELMAAVASWIESGGASLQKPTHFEVSDGKY